MKIDRLLGILTTLLRKKSVTAPYLAEKFEVSSRTIRRDIDTLCQAGIPVMTTRGAGGGISIAEGYRLDKSLLTYEELSNIAASLKGLGTVMEETQVGRTLEKLSISREDAVMSLRDSVVIDLASHYKGSLTEKIATLKGAIAQSRVVAFDYYYEKGDCVRRVEPYCVVFQWSAWYVFGFCLSRRDFRLFKLARLWNLSAEAERFVPREIPPEKRSMSVSFTDHLKLVALFEPSEKYRIIDEYGPNCFTVEPDGRLRAELAYTNAMFMMGWLLAFGDRAQVLAPASMVEEMRRVAHKLSALYE